MTEKITTDNFIKKSPQGMLWVLQYQQKIIFQLTINYQKLIHQDLPPPGL